VIQPDFAIQSRIRIGLDFEKALLALQSNIKAVDSFLSKWSFFADFILFFILDLLQSEVVTQISVL